MIGDNIVAYDSLETVRNSVKDLTDAAMEAGNQNLKQTFIQMRNQAEQDHEKLYHIAEQNGWYLAADKANPQEISRFNSFFQQNYQNAQIQQQSYGGGSQQIRQQGYGPRGQQQFMGSVQQPRYQTTSSQQQNY